MKLGTHESPEANLLVDVEGPVCSRTQLPARHQRSLVCSDVHTFPNSPS